MPRIILANSRAILLWLCGAALCALSMLVIWVAAQVEARMIRQESTASVVSDRQGPQLEQALRSLSDAWREENRQKR